jgi:predicted transcriptional regulator YdeE
MDALKQAEPRIEKWGPFTVIGAGVDCGNDPSPIFALWNRFFTDYGAPDTHNGVVGVCFTTAPDFFHYMAAYLVPHGTKAPEGLSQKTFPGTMFAVWPFKGTPKEMGLTFGDIYKSRLAAAGLTRIPAASASNVSAQPDGQATGTLSADSWAWVRALHCAIFISAA